MTKSFNKLSERKAFKLAVKGYFRSLEITYNRENDTYHPHFHMILAVDDNYFTNSRVYLSRKKWTSLWKSCLKVDYTPIVHITAFKTGTKKQTAKSIAETAKYTVKDEDYLILEDKELSKETVYILDRALVNRRLVAFGGKLRTIQRQLNLDDVIDGHLVNTNNEDELREHIKYHIEVYNWSIGYKQYFKATF